MKDLKTEEMRDLMEVLNKHKLSFQERKGGQVWKNIVMALCQVYREDRTAIYEALSDSTIKKFIPSGGAKVTRNKNLVDTDAGCEGCPPVKSIGSDKTVIKPAPKQREFTSIEDILDSFDSSAGAIQAYAQMSGIVIPANVKKAETIAKYLFEGLQAKKETPIDSLNDEEE